MKKTKTVSQQINWAVTKFGGKKPTITKTSDGRTTYAWKKVTKNIKAPGAKGFITMAEIEISEGGA